jgi:nucleotide-binding universal stress UspA family protein
MSWLPKQNVLVPIDFSESSWDAIPTAIELAASSGNVHVLHVLVPLEGLSPGVVWGEVTDASRESAVRETFAEQAASRNLADVIFDVTFGDPGFVITEHAKKNNADLIVIPSHGYGGFQRLVLGSVAERVIRHADCPVLVLRRDDAE